MLLVAAFALGQALGQAQPVVPGLLHERHGLDAAGQGRVLIEELRCAWCHKGPVKRKLGPNLSAVGARVDAGYLKQFLLDPHTADPGTQMPDILGVVPEDERDTTADVLTHYLKSLSDEKFSRATVDASMVGAGKKLFEKVGCITCHAPGNGVGLKHVPAKYGLDSLSTFLFQPRHARPDGRMPDMNLTRDEARSIAAFLLGAKELRVTELKPNPAKVQAGKLVFRRLNCTSCHKLPNQKSQLKLPMAELTAGKGCLAETPDGVPNFNLSAAQRESIGKALAGIEKPLPDRQQIQHTMTAFNCTACHTRDGAGGAGDARDGVSHDALRAGDALNLLGGAAPQTSEGQRHDRRAGRGVRRYASTYQSCHRGRHGRGPPLGRLH